MKSFSSGEVAKFCDVNPRTVIRWIEAGKLNAHKLPGRGNNRIVREDLVAFLKMNRIPIPRDLHQDGEELCLIIGDSKQFCFDVQRVVKIAGYLPKIIADGVLAGINIALQKPSLIVIDGNVTKPNAEQLLQQVKSGLDYSPCLLLFEERPDRLVNMDPNTNIVYMSKPLDTYALSLVVGSIVESQKEEAFI